MGITVSLLIEKNKKSKPLSLCFYETNKPRKYKSISNKFTNKFDYRDWNSKKKVFFDRIVNSKLNNEIAARCLKQYTDVLLEEPNITLEELYNYFEKKEDRNSVSLYSYIKKNIESEKKKDSGRNFTLYEKLAKKMLLFNPNLDKVFLNKIDYQFCESFKDWLIDINKGKSYHNITVTFMIVLRRANKDINVTFDINQIRGFKFSDYQPRCSDEELKIPDTLSVKQIKAFKDLDLTKVQGNYTIERVQLFHDFCLLMLETFVRPCDAVLLNISNIRHSMVGDCIAYVPKKKASSNSKSRLASFPLSDKVKAFIDKYKDISKDGYILPIMSQSACLSYKDGKEGLLKDFNKKVNVWLKKVAPAIGVDKEIMNAYIFRHTVISYALNVQCIPLISVAQRAGTSPIMISNHYNNSGIQAVENNILSDKKEEDILYNGDYKNAI